MNPVERRADIEAAMRNQPPTNIVRTETKPMKGFRTLLANALVIGVTAILNWVVGLDWSEYVSPEMAIIILGMANMALRLITDTPVGEPTKTLRAAKHEA